MLSLETRSRSRDLSRPHFHGLGLVGPGLGPVGSGLGLVGPVFGLVGPGLGRVGPGLLTSLVVIRISKLN